MTEQLSQAAPTPTEDEPGPVSWVLDGRPVHAHEGELVIAAAERAGVYIPRFCYHPRMKPVGMCRMCLVEVTGPRGPALQPACFIPVTPDMEVSTTSERVKKAQDGVLEFLLVNHPLDCPVCDKGGECPLQDQTVAYGPGESRFVEEKRHFEKPIAISELVLLDRERCIQCARCTRFAEEVAGEALIDFAGRGERVEVATFPDRPFSSYFSGNTVQICPVGALTATPYRFTARPWDLDQVESTCTTCALGCRVAVQSSANRLTRLLGIDADPVNQGWLCDKGRFAFEAVNGDEVAAGPIPVAAVRQAEDEVDVAPATAAQVESLTVARGQFAGEVRQTGKLVTGRLTEPMVRKNGELVPTGWGEALAAAAEGLRRAVASGGPESVAVLGGARLTNEGAYAWTKLAKGVLGTDSVDAQLGDGLPGELVVGLPRATLDQACNATVVVSLTGDVREELPVLYLRLRGALLAGATALIELATAPSALSRYAAVRLPLRPGDAPAVAEALTRSGVAAAPGHPEGPAWAPAQLETARQLLATAGSGGDGVVVLLGRPSVAEDAGFVAEAARLLAMAWPAARFLPTLRRGNVHGALDMGMAPGLLPGRVSIENGRSWFDAAWGKVPERRGRDATAMLSSLTGRAPTLPESGPPTRALVLVGADPLEDYPDRQLAERALEAADLVVVVAGHPSECLEHADVVLPVAVAHERPGTTTNVEGRVSRLGQKLVPAGLAWADWVIAASLAEELGGDLGVGSVEALTDEIERVAPSHRGLTRSVLSAGWARDGVVVPLPAPDGGAGTTGRPRPVAPIDPMAIPGVESVERQGAPPRVGSAEPPGLEGGAGTGSREGGEAAGTGTLPPLVAVGWARDEGAHAAPADSYSLRLVCTRRLYDSGSAVTSSPSVSPLVASAQAHANPYDLDRLGATTGDRVRVRSPRGALVLEARADPETPRGVLMIEFNVPSDDVAPNAAARLIDATAPVTEVRLESL